MDQARVSVWLSTKVAPLLAWIGMILWVASRPSSRLLPAGWGVLRAVPRRLFQYPYHVLAFFVLAVLFVRCLGFRPGQARRTTELLALTGSFAVSIGSEIIQIGVLTRTATLRDVVLDLVGTCLGLLFLRRRVGARAERRRSA